MENKAVFREISNEIMISKKSTPEFYLLYQQSILLSLKEQGVLDEIQYQLCWDASVSYTHLDVYKRQF